MLQTNRSTKKKEKKDSNFLTKKMINMKVCFSFLMLLLCSLYCFSQSNYPEPSKTPTRLFYIQHSNNHNTYVYDVNLIENNINAAQPINEYRIVYTKGGVKKPLTSIQKNLAYGMTLIDSKANLFKFSIAATEKVYFYLDYTKGEAISISVTINNNRMYLDKMFVQIKEGHFGVNTKAEYVLFYGKDYYTHKPIIEKMVLD